jgi:hypothetical protein
LVNRSKVPPSRSTRSISTKLDPGGDFFAPSRPKLKVSRWHDLPKRAARHAGAIADALKEIEPAQRRASAVTSATIELRIFSGSITKAKTVAAAAGICISRWTTRGSDVTGCQAEWRLGGSRACYHRIVVDKGGVSNS